jgi:hypothetical protein
LDWDAAVVSGRLDTETDHTFNGPGATITATHVGYWAGSTFKNSHPLSTPRSIGPGDTLTILTNELALILPLTA